MKHTLLVLLLLLLCCFSASAQERKRSDIFKEPSFWVNVAGAVGDTVSSAIVIDGVRVRELNPIVAGRDGRLDLRRAIPLKAALVFAPMLMYKERPKATRIFMYVAGGLQLAVTARTVHIGFKYRF